MPLTDIKSYIIPLVALILGACGQRSGEGSDRLYEEEVGLSDSLSTHGEVCYAYLNEKDTVRLHVKNKRKGRMTGTLIYRFFEKDANSGAFDGEMKGDTLLAEYTFASEGRISTREVAFLFKDNLVVEGHGPMEEEGGVLRFATSKHLEFGGGIELLRVKCDGSD
ncbi:hypothetical protein [Echinicola strongylocentroti]|nr:hypothetical protein [Echinicola strongylocentroti]